MGPADLPHLTVAAVHEGHCTGRYDPTPWVGEGWVGGLHVGGGRFLWGRFRGVDSAACTCDFYPDHAAELAAVRPGESYPLVDGYWGERAELVLDERRCWRRARFEAGDMVRFPAAEGGGWMATRASPEAPAGGEVVPGGWDHQHCEICQKKTGRGGEAEGFVSGPASWVCEGCYASFVAPRSLSFVTEWADPGAAAEGGA